MDDNGIKKIVMNDTPVSRDHDRSRFIDSVVIAGMQEGRNTVQK